MYSNEMSRGWGQLRNKIFSRKPRRKPIQTTHGGTASSGNRIQVQTIHPVENESGDTQSTPNE